MIRLDLRIYVRLLIVVRAGKGQKERKQGFPRFHGCVMSIAKSGTNDMGSPCDAGNVWGFEGKLRTVCAYTDRLG